MSTQRPIQPRLPTAADFPSTIQLDIIPPPQDQAPLNILLLLHGLGDTETPFSALGRRLNLPYTACISIRAPSPLPPLLTGSAAPAFHWGDDLIFDQSTSELDPDAGFVKTAAALGEQVIETVLMAKCHYEPRDLMLFGFGQGAMAALHVAALKPDAEFAGVVSVGGRLPSSSPSPPAGRAARTPVLVLAGSRSPQVTRSALDALKAGFQDVEYVKWAKLGDTMPASREEMMPIMRFFARRLKTRAGVPEGAIELG